MSKIVKGVGRAVGKVVKGVASAVKKVAKSKLGKIILIAAAVYFGGAALIGSMGGGAFGIGATATGLEGAAAGISQAWSGLTGAIGLGSTATAAAPAAGTNALTTLPAWGEIPISTAGLSGLPAGAAAPGVTAAGGAAAGAATTGGGAGAGWFSNLSPLAQHAVVSGGTQLIGQTVSGIGSQMAARDARMEREQAQARYNQNVGTSLWGEVPGAQATETYGSTPPPPSASEQARLLADSYGQRLRAQPMGLIGQGMWSAPRTYRG